MNHSVTNPSSILDMDALTIAEKIKKQELTSLQVVEKYIEHINNVNPTLNFLVEDRFQEARREAKLADEMIQHGEAKGKLFGVPISIKEAFDVKGMKTTGGLIHNKNHIAKKDAEVVSALKKEGAIILGKTNTPVLCFCQETDNRLYGRTNNPWDISRTAGGSSGGEGSLLAVGGAAVGLGSDIGGSIRFPSHFNGVIGFKSGNKQVSQAGSFPFVHQPFQERMLGIGGMGKSVADVELINQIIAIQKPEKKDISSFRVVFPDQALHYPVSHSTKKALKNVRGFLKKEMEVTDEEPPYFKDSALLWQLIMSIDGAKEISNLAFNGRKHLLLLEYMKDRFFKSSDIHWYFSWAAFGAKLFKPNKKQVKRIDETIQTGEPLVQDFLSNQLLLLPVYHTAAPLHGQVYKQLFSIKKTFLTYIPFVAYANTWGLPALTIPISEDEHGLPIAIQIISSVGNEDAIFHLGKILERSFRGYRRANI